MALPTHSLAPDISSAPPDFLKSILPRNNSELAAFLSSLPGPQDKWRQLEDFH